MVSPVMADFSPDQSKPRHNAPLTFATFVLTPGCETSPLRIVSPHGLTECVCGNPDVFFSPHTFRVGVLVGGHLSGQEGLSLPDADIHQVPVVLHALHAAAERLHTARGGQPPVNTHADHSPREGWDQVSLRGDIVAFLRAIQETTNIVIFSSSCFILEEKYRLKY